MCASPANGPAGRCHPAGSARRLPKSPTRGGHCAPSRSRRPPGGAGCTWERGPRSARARSRRALGQQLSLIHI
eukprot:5891515-Alexandrium_andersonii.AAC.1